MSSLHITLDEAARLYLGSTYDLTFEEYRAKKNQIKSVIQRAINSGQVIASDDQIDFASFYNWLNADKIQTAFHIRADIWEKFKNANSGKNLSYEVEKLMAKSLGHNTP